MAVIPVGLSLGWAQLLRLSPWVGVGPICQTVLGVSRVSLGGKSDSIVGRAYAHRQPRFDPQHPISSPNPARSEVIPEFRV